MDQLDNFVRTTWRTALLVLCSALIGASVLYLFSYRNAPDRDFFELFTRDLHVNYHFYTGPEGGRFEEIGKYLSDRDDESWFDGFSIKKEHSSGSPENARTVATTGGAFALVEERAIRAHEWTAERIIRVAPIHMEKLQILYSKEHWRSVNAGREEGEPRLAAEMSDASKAFFRTARIYAGPSGSGTRLMTSFLLDAVKIQPKATMSGTFRNISQAFASDARDRPDVAVAFAAPLAEIAQVLKNNPNIGLLPIDPSLGPLLQRSGVYVEPTSLPELDRKDVETLGAFAWLVASADVAPQHIAQIVRVLKGFEPSGGALSADSRTSVDTLENVAASFERTGIEHDRTLYFSLGEFALKSLALTVFLFYWLGSALSAYLRSNMMMEYMQLRDAVGAARNLEPQETHEKIEDTLEKIDQSLTRIHRSCANGALLIRHRDQLTLLFEELEKRLMRVCRTYVRNLAKDPNASHYARAVEIAARWHTRDYIDGEDYERLVKLPTIPPSHEPHAG